MTELTARAIERKIPLPTYSLGEELINSISHLMGAGLGVAALVLCITRSVTHGDGFALASSIIYGLSLIVLYAMSGVYHVTPPCIGKRILRVMDHCTIYFLIAGTYTPFTLVMLRASVGWPLFGFIWASAVLGIVLNAIDVERFKVFSMVCYLVMGWCVVLTFPTLSANLAHEGIMLLIYGGVAYTLGAILYGIGSKVKYMHSVWHFFVLAGSILHFFSIYFFVI